METLSPDPIDEIQLLNEPLGNESLNFDIETESHNYCLRKRNSIFEFKFKETIDRERDNNPFLFSVVASILFFPLFLQIIILFFLFFLLIWKFLKYCSEFWKNFFLVFFPCFKNRKFLKILDREKVIVINNNLEKRNFIITYFIEKFKNSSLLSYTGILEKNLLIKNDIEENEKKVSLENLLEEKTNFVVYDLSYLVLKKENKEKEVHNFPVELAKRVWKDDKFFSCFSFFSKNSQFWNELEKNFSFLRIECKKIVNFLYFFYIVELRVIYSWGEFEDLKIVLKNSFYKDFLNKFDKMFLKIEDNF